MNGKKLLLIWRGYLLGLIQGSVAYSSNCKPFLFFVTCLVVQINFLSIPVSPPFHAPVGGPKSFIPFFHFSNPLFFLVHSWYSFRDLLDYRLHFPLLISFSLCFPVQLGAAPPFFHSSNPSDIFCFEYSFGPANYALLPTCILPFPSMILPPPNIIHYFF